MAIPSTREEFKKACLRALGAPVIEINVDDDQVDDRIDEALKYYADYHFDGSEKIYYKHQVTAQNKLDKYITLPENIIGAVRIFEFDSIMGGASSGGAIDMFSIQYQIALNDLYTLTSASMLPYYLMRSNLSLVAEMLVGQKPIRYNRHTDRLYVDMNWDIIEEGRFLLVEAYSVLDPDEYTDVWGDRWLKKYATAKIKLQWGNNMKKFDNMTLPGGVKMNGQQIYDEAYAEIEKLESEMIESYSLPSIPMVG